MNRKNVGKSSSSLIGCRISLIVRSGCRFEWISVHHSILASDDAINNLSKYSSLIFKRVLNYFLLTREACTDPQK